MPSKSRSNITLYGSMATLLTLSLSGFSMGCTTGDDDDTPTPTPVSSPTPEPTATPADPTSTPLPPRTSISGTVTAVDRDSGVALDSATFSARSGKIVVYAVSDPADIRYPLGKATLNAPGFYSLEVPADSGPLFVVAVADIDADEIITGYDLQRESLDSPVSVGADPIEGVDVVLDLAARPTGGGGCGGAGLFAGNVLYDNPAGAGVSIAVVGFRGDYSGKILGKQERDGSGEFGVSVNVCTDTTALVAYADVDGNGLYEPCDPAGLAEDNPYPLSELGGSNINILIEGVGPSGLPRPISYVSLSGSVAAHDTYAGTPIYLTAMVEGTSTVLGSAELSAPGNFTFRTPGGLGSVLVRAITDSNGDGVLDPTFDANGSATVSVGGSSLGGIGIQLVQPVYDTGLAGTISYSGTATPADQVVIALFDDPDMTGGPLRLQVFNPLFPLVYSFMELDPGTYYVLGMLDVNGDSNGEGPGPQDVVGAYTQNGSTLAPIEVQDNVVTLDINFTLGNYTYSP